ncbi:MAG: ABC transporter substrate-binding protein [Acidimicrobiales bacterium]
MELKQVALALLGGVAVIASACSSGSPPATGPTSQARPSSSVFAKGRTVTVAVPYLPTNFNPSTPAGANSVTQMVMAQVWPQAFVIDPEYLANTTGFIDSAEVVGLSPMTVSYVIDPKAMWSDGYPITAADFEYNWQQQLQTSPLMASVGLLAGYRDIKSISGSNGGKTVTVVFKSPYSDWEGLFADLIPAHVAQRAGWVSGFAGFRRSNVISGGPFIVSSVKPGKRLVLTRNTRYWGAPAHLQSIVFLVERSGSASLAALGNGSVSIAEVTPSPQVDTVIARDQAPGSGLSVTTTPSPVLWQLVFNLNDPVVGNRPMRTALALVTDRDQLVADSVGLEDPLTVGADSRVFAQGQQVPGAPVASPAVYDPVKAAALFKLLGYTPDEYGVLRAYGTGSPLALTITGPRGDGVTDALELQLQAEWASCGVGLVIHNVPMNDLLKTALPQGRYQLALAPYVMPVFATWNSIIYTDPVLPVRTSFPPNLGMLVVGPGGPVGRSPGLTTGGTWPWSVPTPVGTEPGATSVGAVTRDITGLEDPEVAVYLREIMRELNADKQYQLLSKLDTLLTQDLPTLPLFQAPVSLVQQADIVNVSESPGSAGPLWDAEDWVVELASANG